MFSQRDKTKIKQNKGNQGKIYHSNPKRSWSSECEDLPQKILRKIPKIIIFFSILIYVLILCWKIIHEILYYKLQKLIDLLIKSYIPLVILKKIMNGLSIVLIISFIKKYNKRTFIYYKCVVQKYLCY